MESTDQQSRGALPTVWCRREGRLGRITLNRPKALNALNLGMIDAMATALQAWEADSRVEVVVLDGAGERGFCAGGDLMVVYDAARNDPEIARTLWREEYLLDARIACFPRPVVSLMDGIVMGGGIGLSAHADIRIVTERSVLAMPEVAIGLAPDVGGALLLARAPGEVGTHLALTASRVGAADALYCGLADHLVPSSRLADLVVALQHGDPAEVVAETARSTTESSTPPATLPLDRSWIDACYGAGDVEEIISRLEGRPESAARRAAEALREGAPTSVKVTLRALREAAGLDDLKSCLVQDFRVSCRLLGEPDLAEGIRAAVIDKDRRPRWDPARLVDVTADTVARHFLPLEDDLEFPRPAPEGWSGPRRS